MSGTIPENYLELTGKSDESVAKATGRTWPEWVAWLDACDASELPHPEIARRVADSGVSMWWSQTVTVGYERIRGLREVGQRRGGGFDMNKSRTVPVSLSKLFDAWAPEARAAWLDVALEDSTVSPPKSRRMKTDAGATVALWFTEKGPDKCSVSVQIGGLPDKAAADREKAAWSERLDRLVSWVR